MPEIQHIKCNRELTEEVEREVVGFLNSREGGGILIGVGNDGSLAGLADPDGNKLKIKDRLKQNFGGNKELMRIFRDLDMVECLGSGIPRILRAYPRECFRFSDNSLRMVFPFAASEKTSEKTGAFQQDTQQATQQGSEKMIRLLRADPQRSATVLDDEIGIPARRVEKQNAKLPAKSGLKRIGLDKRGHWEVIDE